MITPEELKQIMPNAGNRAARYADHLNTVMERYEINTPERQAMFLAQIGHESGSLRYTQEIASGEAYEGRADLGNTEDGDGVRFKGHGFIQLTGRANHQKYADDKGMSLDEVLAYLQTDEGAADVAGWFWFTRGLSELADRGNFLLVTKRINGGTNGYADRLAFYERAKQVLG